MPDGMWTAIAIFVTASVVGDIGYHSAATILVILGIARLFDD
jgi:hypothetical protein